MNHESILRFFSFIILSTSRRKYLRYIHVCIVIKNLLIYSRTSSNKWVEMCRKKFELRNISFEMSINNCQLQLNYIVLTGGFSEFQNLAIFWSKNDDFRSKSCFFDQNLTFFDQKTSNFDQKSIIYQLKSLFFDQKIVKFWNSEKPPVSTM